MLSNAEINRIAEKTSELLFETLLVVQDELLTADAAAEMLGWSTPTLLKQADVLGGWKIGRQWRFSKNALMMAVKSGMCDK